MHSLTPFLEFAVVVPDTGLPWDLYCDHVGGDPLVALVMLGQADACGWVWMSTGFVWLTPHGAAEVCRLLGGLGEA